MAKPKAPVAAGWRNRIVGQGVAVPGELVANPRNWRIHPERQQNALAGLLDQVGWVQNIIVNRQTGYVVDGHLRVAMAAGRGETEIPVLYVDLDESEEALVLATLDPLAALAETDAGLLRSLLDGVAIENEYLAALVQQDDDAEPPGEPVASGPAPTLADRFLVPPFTVLDARQGYWQDRKRQWLGLGIQSELGRGESLIPEGGAYTRGRNASPGGSPRPAMQIEDGHTVRGDGAGRRLTFVAGNRAVEDMDPTSREILRSGSGTSIFDPVLCELAYRWFTADGAAILDPFAGGSVRGIVAGMLGRAYTGIDLSAPQIAANVVQRDQFVARGILPIAPAWEQGDSGAVLATMDADAMFDFVFTCPPYLDLEEYSDDPRDLSHMPADQFEPAYRDIIAKACARLRDDRFACIVVGDVRDNRGLYRDFPGMTIRAFRDAGLALYNEAILVTAVGSLSIRAGRQFAASRKLGKAHQNVLVFVKGSPAKACEWAGPIVIPDPAEMFGEVTEE